MKILYVEDTVVYTRTARRLAASLGHELIVAGTGAEGYTLAHQKPDLILMDIHLPDTDGLTLTRKLRADQLTMPIVAITADTLSCSREEALEAGCTDFIEKPVSLERLRGLFEHYGT